MEARAQLLRWLADGSAIGTSAVGELSQESGGWALDVVVGPCWLPEAGERLDVRIDRDGRRGQAQVEELLPLEAGRARVSLAGMGPLRAVSPGMH